MWGYDDDDLYCNIIRVGGGRRARQTLFARGVRLGRQREISPRGRISPRGHPRFSPRVFILVRYNTTADAYTRIIRYIITYYLY